MFFLKLMPPVSIRPDGAWDPAGHHLSPAVADICPKTAERPPPPPHTHTLSVTDSDYVVPLLKHAYRRNGDILDR